MSVLLLAGGVAYLAAARSGIGVEEAVAWLRSIRGHWWTPLVYVAAYTLMNLLFIPPLPLSIAAVVLWGWARGGTIELLAATIGALFPYLVARSASREWLAARLANHRKLAAILDREGFSMVLTLRFVPVIPYTLLNYLAGFSAIRPLPYVAATLLGMIPSTFIFAYFVDGLVQGLVRPREVTMHIFAAGALLAALVLLTRFLGRRVTARLHRNETS